MDEKQPEKQTAHYPLDDVKRAFAEGRFVVPNRVRAYMDVKEWDDAAIVACVQALTNGDLHKSQLHRSRPGIWLDIYRPAFRGSRLYVKLTLAESEAALIVLSFCIDGEAH